MSADTPSRQISIWDPVIVRRASIDAVRKLHPAVMARNPVMFVVEIGCVLATWRLGQDVLAGTGDPAFEAQITGWLWLTIFFANFAEAMAEGRGKAQAETLRRAKVILEVKTQCVVIVSTIRYRARSLDLKRGRPSL